MFNSNGKKRIDPVPGIHTLIGKGTLLKGEVHADENSLRIEGAVEGTINSQGEVTIAPGGIVKGTIYAKHLTVTGRAEGVFKIAECLEIHGTGWVEGEVELGSLVVDEGGTLQGTCTRRGASQEVHGAGQQPAQAKPKPEERPLDRPGAPMGLPDHMAAGPALLQRNKGN